jgi:hypothetical protein
MNFPSPQYAKVTRSRGCRIPRPFAGAALAVIFAMGLCGQAAAQPDGDAEQLLESIKQAFVDATLEESVNVISSGFIDSSGRLIESAYFETGSAVRGVRVLDYLQGDTPPRPRAGLDVLPAALQHSEGVCRPQLANKYTRTVLTSQQVQLNSGRINNAMVPELQLALDEALTAALLESTAWVAVRTDARLAQLSHYQSLMTGLKPFEQADYRIELQFDTVERPPSWREPLRLARQTADQAADLLRRTVRNNPVAPVFSSAVLGRVEFAYSLRLQNLHSGEELLSASYRQSLAPRRETLVNYGEMTALLPQLQRERQAFINEADQLFNCEVERLSLRHAGSENNDSGMDAGLHLNVGTLNGAMPGDRFLLSTTAINQVDNVLNSDLIAQLSIGEIVASSAYESQLQIIAGNGSAAMLRYAVPF